VATCMPGSTRKRYGPSQTHKQFFLSLQVLPVTETHEKWEEALQKSTSLLDRQKDLVGYYVSIVNSMLTCFRKTLPVEAGVLS
jgi:hypothetical protein